MKLKRHRDSLNHPKGNAGAREHDKRTCHVLPSPPSPLTQRSLSCLASSQNPHLPRYDATLRQLTHPKKERKKKESFPLQSRDHFLLTSDHRAHVQSISGRGNPSRPVLDNTFSFQHFSVAASTSSASRFKKPLV